MPTLAFGEGRIVIIQKFLAIKRFEALQDPVPNPASSNGTDDFTLEIKSISGNYRDIPVATFYHFVSGYKVPDEQEDRHHNVFCDRSHVGPGDLQDLDLMVNGFERGRVNTNLFPEEFVKWRLPAFKSM